MHLQYVLNIDVRVMVISTFLFISGINQALTDLKSKFNQMTLEHNKLAQKFRKDIESLETVFINATKSSK